MRLATWNCRQGIDAKRHAFERLGADVVVVPECSSEPELAREPGVSFLWRGDYAPKGLGVIAFNGWTVEPREAPVELPWVLPVRVLAPGGGHAFDLLAVWTVARKDGRPGYAGQIARVIDAWADELAAGRTIVAGDFNSIAQGPSGRAHARNIARFEELGMRSGYHAHAKQEHGSEAAMTLQWVARGRIRQGYHCDYVVVPESLLSQVTAVTVGPVEEWIDSRLSDHCPVLVDFAFTT
jgi:endonuclease/exonuclease/phosphatase (EEP) superfamily protein YafD